MPNPSFLLLLFTVLFTQTVHALDIGERAPYFILPEIATGKKTSLFDTEEPLMLIYVWATWCKTCPRGMQYLTQLHDTYAKQGLTIITINTDDQLPRAQEFLDAYPVPFTVLRDTQNLAFQHFKNRDVPALYLVEQTGRVVFLRKPYRPSKDELALGKAVQQSLTLDQRIHSWQEELNRIQGYLDQLESEKNVQLKQQKRLEESKKTATPLPILE